MRISILTLGCKTNQAESLNIESILKLAGNDVVAISESPDLCILNTCTVTAKADQQSRQLIHKALRSNAKVIVTGCYAELNADEIRKMGHAIDVVKNSDKDNIISKLTTIDESSLSISSHYPRHRPIVKVQDGCNFSCSYCSIPMARGKSRSELFDKIIGRINRYDLAGYKEVVLTGIHLGTYGFDFKPQKSLSLLLKGILKETSIGRIRLSSVEMNEINEDLLDTISDVRICKHLHIPLQSGDDYILRKMSRTYSASDFASKLEHITGRFPDIAVGTDVITGFPGESEESFLKTCSFIESLPFAYVHVFPYSSRPGTKAAGYDDKIPDFTKKQRVGILRKIAEAKRRDYIVSQFNKVLEIIIEYKSAEGFFGTSANYIKVLLPLDFDLCEETLMNIKVAGYKNCHALGIPVNNQEPINI
jgi:threonylcarbamoyladenosine tRNA methylthiotransferase MtaB